MASVFKDIDILVFDYHLDLRPVLSPARLRPDFGFLSDAAAYQSKQSAAQSFTAGALEFRPLTPRSRKRNRFWRRYCSAFPTGATPDWDTQVPFTIRPNTSLGFDAGKASAKLRSSIQVNSVGWSTGIELAISGNLGIDELKALTERLLDKQQTPFTVGAVATSLPGVMKHFGTLWQNHAYTDPRLPPADLNPIQRHIVISISRYQGEAKPFRQKEDSSAGMTDEECAQFHSILLGQPFEISSLPAVDKKQGYTYIQFGDTSNFAISYFGHGSLIFMQEDAEETKGRRKSIGCMARNLGQFCQVVLGLGNVVAYAAGEQRMQGLATTLKSSLTSLGKNYTNQFGKAWFGKHSFLKPASSSGG